MELKYKWHGYTVHGNCDDDENGIKALSLANVLFVVNDNISNEFSNKYGCELWDYGIVEWKREWKIKMANKWQLSVNICVRLDPDIFEGDVQDSLGQTIVRNL